MLKFKDLAFDIAKTLECLFKCAVYFPVLHPQGKNCTGQEFNALGDMLSTSSWELPQMEEYKNDLVQPEFLGVPAIPKATGVALALQEQKRPDPNGPTNQEQWKKVEKMVA